jgi:acetyltransferase-like isoleucine patch superfamily enzyme
MQFIAGRAKRGFIGQVIIGNTDINGTSIASYQKVEIADNVLSGPNVVIMDCNGRRLEGKLAEEESDFPADSCPVKICKGAWIGDRALMLIA